MRVKPVSGKGLSVLNTACLIIYFIGVIVFIAFGYKVSTKGLENQRTWLKVTVNLMGTSHVERNIWDETSQSGYYATYIWYDGSNMMHTFQDSRLYTYMSDIPQEKEVYVNPENLDEWQNEVNEDIHVYIIGCGCFLLLIGFGWFQSTKL